MMTLEVQVEKPYMSINADGKCSADIADRGDSLTYTVCDTPNAKGNSSKKLSRLFSTGNIGVFSVSRSDKWLLSLISIDKHCFFHPLFSFGVDVPDVPQPYCTSNPTVSAHGLSHHR